MTDTERALYLALKTLYSVVIGYKNMPTETIHPITASTLVTTKAILDKYDSKLKT